MLGRQQHHLCGRSDRAGWVRSGRWLQLGGLGDRPQGGREGEKCEIGVSSRICGALAKGKQHKGFTAAIFFSFFFFSPTQEFYRWHFLWRINPSWSNSHSSFFVLAWATAPINRGKIFLFWLCVAEGLENTNGLKTRINDDKREQTMSLCTPFLHPCTSRAKRHALSFLTLRPFPPAWSLHTHTPCHFLPALCQNPQKHHTGALQAKQSTKHPGHTLPAI